MLVVCLPEMRRPAQEHHPDPEKTPEYAVPSGPARKSPAYYRGRYGGEHIQYDGGYGDCLCDRDSPSAR